MTTLYIIRHGETTGNDAGRFQGSTDCGLSERGYAQVERLGERCRDLPFEVLISSPLVRARETASAANRHHGLPMRIDADLAEMHCGDWEEKSWDELRAEYPDEMELWREKPWLFRSPGGETMQQVYDRVSRALQRICHEHRGQTVAIVSHGCAIRNALCFCHGKGIEGLNDILWVRNTSISRVDQDDDGRFTVVFENDFEHVKDIVKL